MASSNTSANLSFSTRALLLLLLFSGCFQSSSAASLPTSYTVLPTHANERWRNPCAGSSTVTIVAGIPKETVTSPTAELIDAFAKLSRRSIGLKQIVNDVKNRYVTDRFGSTSQAEEDRSGRVINGSSSWTASNNSMSETLLICYENLARLAVLTRLTREAEKTAIGNRDFATHFRRVEDDAWAGLYVIMCHLNETMTSWGFEAMSSETIAEVSKITLELPSSVASRHVRDYIVLLALEDSADKLSSSFDRLVGLVPSQTTPSTA